MEKINGKKKKIASMLTLRIFLVLLVVFMVMIVTIIGNTKRDLTARELDKLQMLANQNARIAADFMERPLYEERVIIAAIQTIHNVDEKDRADYMKDLLTGVKSGESNVLSLFYIAEPNAFISGTPNGFSVFATDKGTSVTYDRFAHADEALYNKAKETKNIVIVDPFNKEIDGKQYMVMTVLLPVLDSQNNVAGMVGSNIDTALLNAAPYNNGGFESFNNQIICGHQAVIINSSNPETIGMMFADATRSTEPQRILDSAKDPDPFTFLDTMKDGEKHYRAFVPFNIGTSKVAWLSGTSISKKEFDAQITEQIILMSVIALAGLAALVLFCYFSIAKTLRPIGKLDYAAGETAKGNLGVLVAHHSGDELGSLADSFNASSKTSSFYITEIGRIMGEMSEGNFDIAVSQPFIGDFSGIETSIARFTERMNDTLSGISRASHNVATSAEQVSSTASVMSQGAAEQASSIQQLTATISEISVQVAQNARHAGEASGNASQAGDQIERSNARMQEMIVAMGEINASSDEISKIIKAIQDIAFQTDILALNAAVEAARAGSAGKGFAVVADEVRNLASKSAQAAQSTAELIQNSISSVEHGAKIASDAAGALGDGVVKARAVVESMGGVSSACMGQADSIGQVTQGAEQISRVIQTNAATAEESAAAAQELQAQSQLLKQLVGSFRLKEGEGPMEDRV